MNCAARAQEPFRSRVFCSLIAGNTVSRSLLTWTYGLVTNPTVCPSSENIECFLILAQHGAGLCCLWVPMLLKSERHQYDHLLTPASLLFKHTRTVKKKMLGLIFKYWYFSKHFLIIYSRVSQFWHYQCFWLDNLHYGAVPNTTERLLAPRVPVYCLQWHSCSHVKMFPDTVNTHWLHTVLCHLTAPALNPTQKSSSSSR